MFLLVISSTAYYKNIINFFKIDCFSGFGSISLKFSSLISNLQSSIAEVNADFSLSISLATFEFSFRSFKKLFHVFSIARSSKLISSLLFVDLLINLTVFFIPLNILEKGEKLIFFIIAFSAYFDSFSLFYFF